MRKQIVWCLGLTVSLALVGCHGDDNSPTGPSQIAPAHTAPAPAAAAPSTPAETPETVNAPPSNPSVRVEVLNDGTTKVTNNSGSPFSVKTCFFVNGPHPQQTLSQDGITRSVPAGETKTYPLNVGDLEVPEDLCEVVKIQIDAGPASAIDCTNPSNDLGRLEAWNWTDVDFGECECKPDEEPTVLKTSEPYKGDRVRCTPPIIVDVEQREICYECYEQREDITYSDGCKEWTETIVLEEPIREQVECPCEPGEWEDGQVGEPYPTDQQVECPETDQDGCFECYAQEVEVIQTNGCERRTITRAVDEVFWSQVECPCEEPYAGTPTRDRITFINKDQTTGQYVWRIHNFNQHAAITAKGPGFEETFDTEGLDVVFFTTGFPVAGMSIYDCAGNLLHGTASSNETEKLFCEFVPADVTECPDLGTCFYNVNADDGQEQCFALPGYVSWNDQNHLCELAFPGIVDDDFQLNPGQSAEGCLDKRD